jgi:hypothetical protein
MAEYQNEKYGENKPVPGIGQGMPELTNLIVRNFMQAPPHKKYP